MSVPDWMNYLDLYKSIISRKEKNRRKRKFESLSKATNNSLVKECNEKFQTINYISQMNEVELMECYNNNYKCKGKHFHELKL